MDGNRKITVCVVGDQAEHFQIPKTDFIDQTDTIFDLHSATKNDLP
jgi:hypothetical protein